jgi:hypothetical protein
LLPFSNPRKAASIIVKPIQAMPAYLSSASSTVSSAAGAVSLAASSLISRSFVQLTEKLDDSGTASNASLEDDTGASNVDQEGDASLSAAIETHTLKDKVKSVADQDFNTKLESRKQLVVSSTDQFGDKESDYHTVLDISSRPELLPIPRDTDWSSWITLGLTTAALGVGYYSGGLLAVGAVSQLARGAALAYAVPAAESGRQHLQFLYPIWGESQKATDARIKTLVQQHHLGSFFARIYYIDIAAASPPAALQQGSFQRTFIKPPPSPEVNLDKSLDARHLFHKVGSDLDNEIGAHMKMFSREDCPGSYWDLVHKAGRDIKNVISKHRSHP